MTGLEGTLDGCAMRTWQVQDARARFSELLDASLKEVLTRRGVEAAVLVPPSQADVGGLTSTSGGLGDKAARSCSRRRYRCGYAGAAAGLVRGRIPGMPRPRNEQPAVSVTNAKARAPIAQAAIM